MAKINIEFDGKIYSVDENTLASLASPLERALIQQLAGTGAVIRLRGTDYNVDANKLASARNVLTDHFGNVAGNDSKVTVNGTEYGLSKTKLQNATATMNRTLGGLIQFSKGLEYTLNDDGQSYTVSSIGSCTDEDIVIPAFYEGLPVTAIGVGAFEYGWGFTSVFIPEGVTYIGSYAFCESSIRDISLPSTLAYVADSAFNDCFDLNYRTYNGGEYLGNDETPNLVMHKLTDSTVATFTVPDETILLMSYVFSSCTNLEKVIMHNNIATIPVGAFSGCSGLKDITFGSSITYIDRYAFNGCTNLKNIYYDGDISSWCNLGFRSLRKDHDDFTDYYSSPMQYAENFYLKNSTGEYDLLTGTLTIPDGVKTIKQGAFHGSGWSCITDISIVSDDIEVIGEFAFDGTSYYKDETRWEDGVLYIDEYLIEANRNIPTEYTINSDTKAIADGAFYKLRNSLTSITIPEGIENIGEYTFSLCETLANVVLPSSLKSIGERAFSNTAITSIIIPEGVTHMGYEAFARCENLTNVSVPSSLKFMDSDVFYGGELVFNEHNNARYLGNSTNPYVVLYDVDDSITEFSIPETTKIINQYAFRSCANLTSIVIPEGVTHIGNEAFSSCANLMSITIPNSIEYIGGHYGDFLFDWSEKLIEIINHSSFDVVKNIYPLEVHKGDSKLVKAGDYYFYTVDGTNYLVNYIGTDTDITLPESYNDENYVIYRAFYKNESITSVAIPDYVTSIDYQAFEGCSSLTSVTIGNGVTSIGMYAFCDCNSLTRVIIGNGIANIEWHAFGCENLSDIHINKPEGSIEGSPWGADNATIHWNSTGPAEI